MNDRRKVKVLHVITSLGQGGAQTVLTALVTTTADVVEHTVVSMLDDSPYGDVLRERGVNVSGLNMQRGRVSPTPFLAVRSILRTANPDIVQTWMYHADLLGGVAARLSGFHRVVWGIRNSYAHAPLTRGIVRLCALLSRWTPSIIACCSSEAARAHQALGYRRDKFRIIRNGCNLARFRPDATARGRIRQELGVSQEETLLGMVGRWDAQKDHANLLEALSHLTTHGIAFRCALVGPSMSDDNSTLVSTIHRLGLGDQTMLIGPRFDIPEIMNALDVHVLSSASEAFPNVVAESMACGTPCVATDVGDAAMIVGNPEWVAPPRSPVALAQAVERALACVRRDGRDVVGKRCRDRIEANFSLERMVDAYRVLWAEVMQNPHGRLP